MKERDEHPLPQEKDRHLDVPSEANRDRHINFLEVEEGGNQDTNSHRRDKETEERRKQWQQGLEEGRKANRGEEAS